jgi:membrane associated rhomboid family serine protease
MLLFALWPLGAGDSAIPFMPWQLLTYGFLHGSVMHLAFNMFALWMFGRELEVMMGSKRFLTYYLVCVVGAGCIQLLVAAWQGGPPYPTVGASGGVFGILLAYGMTFPNRMVMLVFPPIPMRAKYFVILIGLFELYVGFSGRSPGIANFAHLGGMLFGFAMLSYWGWPRRR